MKLVEYILSALWPPALPAADAGIFHFDRGYEEQGACGRAQEKPFRDGIDRFFKEQRA